MIKPSKAVLSGFLDVGSYDTLSQNFRELELRQVVITGIFLALSFVLGLVWLVDSIVG